MPRFPQLQLTREVHPPNWEQGMWMMSGNQGEREATDIINILTNIGESKRRGLNRNIAQKYTHTALIET